MVSDIWLRIIKIKSYIIRLSIIRTIPGQYILWPLLHQLWCTGYMSPPIGIDPMIHQTMSRYSTIETRPYPSNNKEGNVLFNDTLNTFYLRLYGVRHMVKDHLDSE